MAVNFEVAGAADEAEPVVTEEATAQTVASVYEAEQTGTVASRLRGKLQELQQRTKRFNVPPDDVWNGELVLVAHPIRIKANMPNVKLIFDATSRIEAMNPDTGQFEEIEGGWLGLGREMGVADENVSAGEIITAVCSSQEVVAGLAEQILAFIMGRQSQIEQALGE